MTSLLLERIELTGLELAPPQTHGAIRLFPVIDPEPRSDLRLIRRSYDSGIGLVDVGDGTSYCGYLPQGLVVSWSRDDEPVALQGATLSRPGRPDPTRCEGPLFHRMARRIDGGHLRLLPLHLALEGFLALHFRGPSTAWPDFRWDATNRGLGARGEWVTPGSSLFGLDDALALFEIHENQVGVLLFVADALASAFVAAHPDDYRALHSSLVGDLYGPTLFRYAIEEGLGSLDLDLHADDVDDLASLKQAVADVRQRWEEQTAWMAGGLIDRPIHSERVYHLSPFRLERFHTILDVDAENHLGEAIVDRHGRIRYLKTFRLSRNQAKRAVLLEHLAAHDWHLDRAAAGLDVERDELIRRIDRAGFGYLLKGDVVTRARDQRRTRG